MYVVVLTKACGNSGGKISEYKIQTCRHITERSALWFVSYLYYCLAEVLRYKPEGRWFESRWGLRDYALTQYFWPHCGPGVDSVSNRNECQGPFSGDKGGRCVGLTTSPLLCADCQSWEPQPPVPLGVCLSLYRVNFAHFSHVQLLGAALYCTWLA